MLPDALLDSDAAWHDASLKCLPSTSGDWIDRRQAIGLPLDWDNVSAQDPSLQSWLEPFLAAKEVRLEWTFDRSLRQNQNANQYVATLTRQTAKDLLGSWWCAVRQSRR